MKMLFSAPATSSLPGSLQIQIPYTRIFCTETPYHLPVPPLRALRNLRGLRAKLPIGMRMQKSFKKSLRCNGRLISFTFRFFKKATELFTAKSVTKKYESQTLR
jgi:hypothetical protein